MKNCVFKVEAFFGVPIYYDNWRETLNVSLTDEQFQRYCDQMAYWITTEEWEDFNRDENGEDYFIKRDLPDIYHVIWETLVDKAPQIWDESIMPYLDQVNIYTPNEIYEKADEINKQKNDEKSKWQDLY